MSRAVAVCAGGFVVRARFGKTGIRLVCCRSIVDDDLNPEERPCQQLDAEGGPVVSSAFLGLTLHSRDGRRKYGLRVVQCRSSAAETIALFRHLYVCEAWEVASGMSQNRL